MIGKAKGWRLAPPLLALALAAGPAMADPTYTLLNFSDLRGWAEDDHQVGLDVFQTTCADIDASDWRTLCGLARTGQEARGFFETFFLPVLIEDGKDTLFTGYYEPELHGARRRGGPYQYPIYRRPDGIDDPWLTRREIEQGAALDAKGLEIAWIDDPVDVFFLQVQGSGRVRLDDGSVIRVGYGGTNGHEYSSVGSELVRRGVYEPHQVSADVIRSWVRRNPQAGRELLWTNDSFVFFREIEDVPAEQGPIGAMGRPVTPGRTIAVDPAMVPLGSPVWIETTGDDPLTRLMVAQDTGSAIKGAQRADIFIGTGDAAGRRAGRIRDGGRMIVLMPIQQALALVPRTVQ